MSKRGINLYIDDILFSIKKIERYIKGVSFDDFCKDERTIDAVIRNIEIIGEAAKNIPKEIQDKNPDIPWKIILSMRNKVAHEYFGVDVDILWKTAKEDIIDLKKKIKKLK